MCFFFFFFLRFFLFFFFVFFFGAPSSISSHFLLLFSFFSLSVPLFFFLILSYITGSSDTFRAAKFRILPICHSNLTNPDTDSSSAQRNCPSYCVSFQNHCTNVPRPIHRSHSEAIYFLSWERPELLFIVIIILSLFRDHFVLSAVAVVVPYQIYSRQLFFALFWQLETSLL